MVDNKEDNMTSSEIYNDVIISIDIILGGIYTADNSMIDNHSVVN